MPPPFGAGAYPAGKTPCGVHVGPSLPYGARVPVAQGDALFFDPNARDAVLLPNGLYQTTHYVDQAVALAISVVLGTLSSVPTQGSGLRALRYAGPTLSSDVTNAVTTALAPLVARGDVTLIRVDVQPNGAGFLTNINYRNLRLPNNPARTVSYPS